MNKAENLLKKLNNETDESRVVVPGASDRVIRKLLYSMSGSFDEPMRIHRDQGIVTVLGTIEGVPLRIRFEPYYSYRG